MSLQTLVRNEISNSILSLCLVVMFVWGLQKAAQYIERVESKGNHLLHKVSCLDTRMGEFENYVLESGSESSCSCDSESTVSSHEPNDTQIV